MEERIGLARVADWITTAAGRIRVRVGPDGKLVACLECDEFDELMLCSS